MSKFLVESKLGSMSFIPIRVVETIWTDIDSEAETIVIEDFSYRLMSLSNLLYTIIDDPVARRKVLLKNEVVGLYQDLSDVQVHAGRIMKNPEIQRLISDLFKEETIPLITHVDGLFLNAFYRRLLRAKLEVNINKSIALTGVGVDSNKVAIDTTFHQGMIDTTFHQGRIDDQNQSPQKYILDAPLVRTLQLVQLICKYVGIPNTITACTFPASKLQISSLWRDISNKLIHYFGEDKIEPILNDGTEHPSQVLLMLNVLFNLWSGSMLTIADIDTISVIPATYITRLIPLLRDLPI